MIRALAIVALSGALAACQSKSSGAPAPAPKPGKGASDASPDFTKLEGKPTYAALCAPCHGVEGKGYAADHAPSLVSKTFLESASDEFLRRSIAAGRPGTSMAAYGKAMGGPLDDAAVHRLTEYLRTFGPAPAPLPAFVGGNADAGAVLYAKNCQSCHGDAKTRGEGVTLGNSQFLASATDSFIRHAIANGRPDTKMVAWAGVLTDAQINDVTAAVRRLGAVPVPVVTPLPEPTGEEPLVINPRGGNPKFTLTGVGKEAGLYVSVDQVAAALASGKKLVIIDARPPPEWMRVHIEGAVSIPYHDMKRLDELPKDGPWVIAYCACPHHLSGIVVDELRKRGYTHSAVLDEGINEWQRRGYPITAAEGVLPPPKEPPLPAGALR